MLFINSKLNIKDNSGVKKVRCIKFLGNNSFKKSASIGDIAVASTVQLRFYSDLLKKKFLKRKINKVLIVTSKKIFKRIDGVSVKFDSTSGILFNNEIRKLEVRDKRKKVIFKVFIPIVKEFASKMCKQLLYFGSVI